MLIVLGIDLLRGLLKRRIQTGPHQHLAGATDILRHRHDCARGYDLAAHPFRFQSITHQSFDDWLHSWLVGSAVLILLNLQMAQSLFLGKVYILLFEVGSIMSMALLSLIVAVPLNSIRNQKTWYRRVNAAIGVGTILFGFSMIYSHAMRPFVHF